MYSEFHYTMHNPKMCVTKKHSSLSNHNQKKKQSTSIQLYKSSHENYDTMSDITTYGLVMILYGLYSKETKKIEIGLMLSVIGTFAFT